MISLNFVCGETETIKLKRREYKVVIYLLEFMGRRIQPFRGVPSPSATSTVFYVFAGKPFPFEGSVTCCYSFYL